MNGEGLLYDSSTPSLLLQPSTTCKIQERTVKHKMKRKSSAVQALTFYDRDGVICIKTELFLGFDASRTDGCHGEVAEEGRKLMGMARKQGVHSWVRISSFEGKKGTGCFSILTMME